MIPGKIRLLLHSFVYATRTRKRSMVFVAVYAVLASGVFLSVARIEHNRSVLVRQSAAMWLNETAPKAVPVSVVPTLKTFIQEKKLPVSRTVAVSYTELDKGRMLYSIDPEEPWAAASLTPALLKSGRFPESAAGEAVITEGFTFRPDFPEDAEIYPAIGTVIKMGEASIRITGIIRAPEDLPPDTDLMVTGPDGFDRLAGKRPAFVKEFVVIARGSTFLPGLFGSVLGNVGKIHRAFLDDADGRRDVSLTQPATGADPSVQTTRDVLSLPLMLFGITGSLVVSLFYGYLAGRYRLREIALLKTLGFDGMEISLYMLAEVILIASAGLVLSFVAVRGYFAVAVAQADFQLNDFFSLVMAACLLGFNIAGFIFTSKRARRVDPMTLFRDN